MNKDDLGNRMKGYENVERKYLTKRMPTIIRLDGKAFHSFTKGLQKPFDMILMESMWETTQYLCKNIMGCKIGYTQSDEITLLLTDYEKINTEAWFDKNVQKMCSISSSMATLAFNNAFREKVAEFELENEATEEIIKQIMIYKRKVNTALFDSRVFNIPKDEACNIFIWRQQDATRNAIQMVGRANFSPKQLNKKNGNQIQEMLFEEKGINFDKFPAYQKRGACIIKETYLKGETLRGRWSVDKVIPVFTQNREYIERLL